MGVLYIPPTYFNVKSYGATGNGTTDDSAAIQACINACGSAGGGVVFFPPGKYFLSVPTGQAYALICAYSAVQFRGCGRASWLCCGGPGGTSATTLLIANSGTTPTATVDFCTVSDLYFNPASQKINYGSAAPNTAALTATAFEIAIPWSMGCTIERVTFGRGNGLSPSDNLPSGEATTIESCVAGCIDIGSTVGRTDSIKINNITATGFYHLIRTHGLQNLDIYFTDSLIDSNTQYACPIMTQGFIAGLIIDNVDFINSLPQLNTSIVTPWPALWLTDNLAIYNKYSNVYFDSHGYGVQIDGGHDNRFTNCWFSPRPYVGAQVNGGWANAFVNCDFYNTGSNGLVFNGGYGHVLAYSMFGSIGATTASDAVHVTGGCTGAQILGNSFVTGVDGGTMNHAITIDANSTYVICDANDTRGATLSGLNNLASGTATVKIGSLNLP